MDQGSCTASSKGTPERRLRVVAALLTAFCVVAIAAAPAAAEVHPLEVKDYVEEFDVSAARAESTLVTQDKATEAGIVEELEGHLGGRYAGVWFDNSAGEFVVPLAGGAKRTAVDDLFEGISTEGRFRSVSVETSWAELEAIHSRIDSALKGMIEEGLVQTALDPSANAVVIEQAEGIDGAAEKKIGAIAKSEQVRVEVRRQESEQLSFTPNACKAQLIGTLMICGNPLRGGVRLMPSGSSLVEDHPFCSAGFKAIGKTDGKRYLLTAGHCVQYFADFMSFDESGIGHYIGHVAAASFPVHDYAAITVNAGTYWDVPSWPSMVAYWGTDLERPIYAESSSYVGQQVCHAGARTGASCGYVTQLDKTASAAEGYPQPVYGMTEFRTPCTYNGDSGGPVFAGNTALGIFSGNTASGTESESEKWANRCTFGGLYTEITEDTDLLGVTVAPRVAPSPPPPPASPPTVQTTPATSIQEGQATLNGTVNPNGSETTYRFEYGKTTSYGKTIPVPSAGAGAGTQAVPAYLSPTLQPRTRYHFRLVASNAGGTSYGSDQAFTTGVRWYLRNSNSAGNQDAAFWFGLPGEKKVTGDWNKDGITTAGNYDPATGVWKLRNSNTTGAADVTFQFGGGPWTTPVTGDWNGDGTTTIGVYAPSTGTWRLKNTNSPGNADVEVQYGGSQFTPVPGDWDGNGTTTIGLFEPNAGSWQLRNQNIHGSPEIVVQYGGSQFRPVVGDWDNNKTTTIGLFEPTSGSWQLRNSNSPGAPQVIFSYGGSQFVPLTGDWDGNGTDTPVLANPNNETVEEWRLRNTSSAGNADLVLEFGAYPNKEVTGDWDNNGTDTVGTYDPMTGIWRLRNSNTTGATDLEFQYGGGPWADPVVGDWDGNGTATIGVFDPATGIWRLKNTNGPGNPDLEIQYGGGPWMEPVTGDWDANKSTTIGVYDPASGVWRLRNSNTPGNPDLDFQYGGGEVWGPLAGDWNGDGKDTVGVGTQ